MREIGTCRTECVENQGSASQECSASAACPSPQTQPRHSKPTQPKKPQRWEGHDRSVQAVRHSLTASVNTIASPASAGTRRRFGGPPRFGSLHSAGKSRLPLCDLQAAR